MDSYDSAVSLLILLSARESKHISQNVKTAFHSAADQPLTYTPTQITHNAKAE